MTNQFECRPERHSQGLKRLCGIVGSALLLSAAALAPAVNAAEDRWSFGIGTGLSSLSLDGDVGFATPSGGVIGDFDLDNGDTADMFESAFGAGGFANKGRWTIHAKFATLTLEDDNRDFDAKWDRTFGEFAVEYMLGKAGNHAFGVIAGVNYTKHEWDFKNKETREKLSPDDDWTDAMIGVTHRLPLGKEWSWSNRIDYAGGDSEGTFNATTSLNWKPFTHWIFNVGLGYRDVEFGDEGDIDDNDFYYYDTDETTISLGFLYVW
jgi:hypothetical protein